MRSLILSLCMLLPLCVDAQVITTVVGNGTFGYSGDGGPATAAKISHVNDVSFDTANIMYFSDVDNHVIRKVDATGTITTIAGTGSAGYNGDGIAASTAQLNYPFDIVFDRHNNLYFADCGNSRIRKIDAVTGIITTVAGTGTAGFSFDHIAAIYSDLNHPYSMAIDTADNLYISDMDNNRIRRVSATIGVIETIAGNGSWGHTGDGGLATSAKIIGPVGIAIDKYGDIYFTESDTGNSVRKVNMSTGIITTVAGTGKRTFSGDGGFATSAGMTPIRITFDTAGELLICDNYNSRVRKVDAADFIYTIVGTGVQGFNGDTLKLLDAQLNMPQGIKLDRKRNIYIAEWGNQRIRKIVNCTNHITAPPVNLTVTVGGAAHFSISDVGTSSYQWQEGTGATFSNLANGGIYSGVNTKTLTITSAPLLLNNKKYRCIIYNGACLDTSTAATLSVWKLGIENTTLANGIGIYPNPASKEIIINSTELINSVKVYDAVGRLMLAKNCNAKKAVINIGSLQPGIYFIDVDGYKQKLVKE